MTVSRSTTPPRTPGYTDSPVTPIQTREDRQMFPVSPPNAPGASSHFNPNPYPYISSQTHLGIASQSGHDGYPPVPPLPLGNRGETPPNTPGASSNFNPKRYIASQSGHDVYPPVPPLSLGNRPKTPQGSPFMLSPDEKQWALEQKSPFSSPPNTQGAPSNLDPYRRPQAPQDSPNRPAPPQGQPPWLSPGHFTTPEPLRRPNTPPPHLGVSSAIPQVEQRPRQQTPIDAWPAYNWDNFGPVPPYGPLFWGVAKQQQQQQQQQQPPQQPPQQIDRDRTPSPDFLHSSSRPLGLELGPDDLTPRGHRHIPDPFRFFRPNELPPFPSVPLSQYVTPPAGATWREFYDFHDSRRANNTNPEQATSTVETTPPVETTPTEGTTSTEGTTPTVVATPPVETTPTEGTTPTVGTTPPVGTTSTEGTTSTGEIHPVG